MWLNLQLELDRLTVGPLKLPEISKFPQGTFHYQLADRPPYMGNFFVGHLFFFMFRILKMRHNDN